jgi:predicted transcriptional regulator
MARWSRILLVLIIAMILALPGTATARYVVEPVAEEYAGEWHDLEEITFRDLPLRVMLLHLLFTILPGLPYMGELFYALSLLVPLGFRRVMRHNILDDDLRRDLYRQITANPGIGTTELGELTGASRGRLRYHLDMLIREGKVAAVSYRNRARHFAGNQQYTALEERIFASLRDETPAVILTHLHRSPGATQNEIKDQLGLAAPTISQHMQQFEAEGIVVRDQKGRSFRYRLTGDAREILNEHQKFPTLKSASLRKWRSVS